MNLDHSMQGRDSKIPMYLPGYLFNAEVSVTTTYVSVAPVAVAKFPQFD